MEKDLEYLLSQARRIAEHREKGAMQAIRKQYKSLLTDLKHFLADEYDKYAEDDKLTYALLQQKSEYARFAEETTAIVNDWFPALSKEVKQVAEDIYRIAYDGMVDAVKKSSTTQDLADNFEGLRNVTPEAIKRVVNAPLFGLTLNETLEKNRKIIVHDIRRTLGVGLANGDRYSTMARKLTDRVDISYRKALLIIRTEGHRVQEQGFHDSATDVNQALENGSTAMRLVKTWKTMHDERVRDTWRANHRKMNDVSVPLDEKFDLGNGVWAESPGSSGSAANDCNCRCFCKYELKEDEEAAKKLPQKQEAQEENNAAEETGAVPRKKNYIDNVSAKVEESLFKMREIRSVLDEISIQRGTSAEETKELIQAGIAKVVQENDFGMRIRGTDLLKVLSDGRFKNQFETGKSGGMFNPESRRNVEYEMFNVPKENGSDMQDADRPVYGMLVPKYDGKSKTKSYYKDGAGSWYGDGVTVILKKDKVVNQATLTVGDSLDYKFMLGATEANNPIFTGSATKDIARALADVGAGDTKSSKVLLETESDRYFEYQLHGKESHSSENIEKVYITKETPYGSPIDRGELIAKLEEHGIPYEIIE